MTTDAMLDAVVITATRTPSRVGDTVAEITVLDRAALDRSSGRTLAELLSQQAGVQSYSNGGLGKASSLSIRGLEARHTLLLVDGVRVGSATLGMPSLDNLPLESIDRIEIVRGPLSGLYGSDAVGGVVQVFTRRGQEGFRPDLKVTAGSDRHALLAAGFTLGQDGWDIAVQAEHTETHGFSATNSAHPFSYDPDRDPFRQDAGSVRVGYRMNADWRAEARVLHADALTDYDDGSARVDEVTFMPLPGPGARTQSRLRNRVMAADLTGTLMPEWRTALRTSRSDDESITIDSNWASGLGKIATERRLLSWEHTVSSPLGQLFAAAERLLEDVTKPPPQYNATSRQTDALSLGWSGNAAGHSWQASARRDRNSQFGSQATGVAAWGYAITAVWRAGMSLGTSFVVPTFNQLYWPASPNYQGGNPNLLPEEGRHAELSLRFHKDSHSARAAWFRHRIRGYITPGAQPGNIDARIDGLSLSCDTQLEAWALNMSLDHMDPQVATGANAGNQLPRRARSALRMQADWTGGDLSGGISWQAFSLRFDEAANTRRLAGYGTLDLRADWRVAPGWTLGARLNNVADKAYETAYGYNQPGREAYVTLRFAPS